MTKAIWENTLIAESNETIIIEGNHYFPPNSVKHAYLKTTDIQTTCPWKGQAHYLNLEIDGHLNPEAAWHYPEPSEAAAQIKDYIAFGNGVQIES
ncbi:MAG: DUF427 domain-containing protein [Chloroflexota bacterium]